jgi:hypothetical protein
MFSRAPPKAKLLEQVKTVAILNKALLDDLDPKLTFLRNKE